jgi:hypothetical protein
VEVKVILKKAVILISLVKESADKQNKELEKDILEKLSEEYAPIPWLKSVEKVTIVEE